jgi:hypothetical protein
MPICVDPAPAGWSNWMPGRPGSGAATGGSAAVGAEVIAGGIAPAGAAGFSGELARSDTPMMDVIMPIAAAVGPAALKRFAS